jgi:hypothetical protein
MASLQGGEVSMKITRFGSSPEGPIALEILYFMTGTLAGLALAVNVHNVKLKLPIDNKFPACYQNICFS